MPDTFDLDNQPPDPQKLPGRPPQPGVRKMPTAPPSAAAPPSGTPLTGQLPTGRASELLQVQSGEDPNRPSWFDRRPTKYDDFASGLLFFAGLAFLAGLGYLLFSMFSGYVADPNFHSSALTHADRVRIKDNIALVILVMWWALSITTACFLFLYYHEDYAGYVLLGLALFMLLVVPYAGHAYFNSRNLIDSDVTSSIYAQLGSQAWLVGIPGVLFTVISIIRSTIEGLAAAKVRRGTLRFGQAAVKDVKPRNKFLGHCWDMPFCKEGLRSKCPIFVAKRGPCWRNKRGCMCDQTIVLMAQAPNWKQNVAATIGKIDGKSTPYSMPELPPQPQLSREAKNERCRQCVIYNLHQEQKYKVLVSVTLAVCLGLLYLNSGSLLGATGALFNWANTFVGKLSITGNSSPVFPDGAPVFVEWLMLGSVILIGMAKLLQVIEYICFKLKI